nr:hypothetical protein [uncultured Arsenicibacter sp.]
MTIREAHNEYRRICDQFGDPWLRPADFLARYVATRLVWLDAKCKEPETEYVRRRLQPFRAELVRNNVSAIPIASVPDFFYLRKVTPWFDGIPDSPDCPPISDDEYGQIMRNPHTRPCDWFPKHREKAGTIEIYSETIPAWVAITYIRKPPVPVFTEDQADNLPEDDLSVGEILERLTGRVDLTLGNFNRSQLISAQEVPKRETNN